MKKAVAGLMVLAVLGLFLAGCFNPVVSSVDNGKAAMSITWNGNSDKDVAETIVAVDNNTRQNASGPKITSNSHSGDFPGIFFIWDSKQKDNGYLKVESWLFDAFESFTLTAKEANKYYDFVITLQPGQRISDDGCYVFFIPKAENNKNINMVFVSEFVEKEQPPEIKKVNIGFIGLYANPDGNYTYSLYWENLEEGGKELVDWDAVYAAYADDQFLVPNWFDEERVLGWQSSGAFSKTFEGARPEISINDFTEGMIEGYYLSFYLEPILKEAVDPQIPDDDFYHIYIDKNTVRIDGEYLYVDVMASGKYNSFAIFADLSYDGTVLQYLSYTYLYGVVASVTQTSGGVSVKCQETLTSILDGIPFDPAKKLATLQFRINDFEGDSITTVLSFTMAQVNPMARLDFVPETKAENFSITLKK